MMPFMAGFFWRTLKRVSPAAYDWMKNGNRTWR
jgi:hypothetical protein